MKTGIELIAEERKRQIEVEGYDIEKDSESYSAMELAGAAGCYIASAMSKNASCIEKQPNARFQVWVEGYQGPNDKYERNKWVDGWPWGKSYDKRDKHDVLRSLVIAGALIAAQIDLIKNME